MGKIHAYNEHFGDATPFTRPAAWNRQASGVSLLTAPSKSNFHRYGVITSLSIGGTEFKPTLKVYTPMDGTDPVEAWPLTFLSWDGEASSPITAGIIVDVPTHKDWADLIHDATKISVTIKFNAGAADGSVADDESWFTEFGTDDEELTGEIPVHNGELQLKPADGKLTIDKEGNQKNKEWILSRRCKWSRA